LHAIARAVAASTALGLASKYDIDLANGVFCWARSARAAWSLSVASVRDHNQGLALDQCGLGDREVRATAVKHPLPPSVDTALTARRVQRPFGIGSKASISVHLHGAPASSWMPEHIATPAASPRPPLNRVRLLPWLLRRARGRATCRRTCGKAARPNWTC
jgi:hypothetical protein